MALCLSSETHDYINSRWDEWSQHVIFDFLGKLFWEEDQRNKNEFCRRASNLQPFLFFLRLANRVGRLQELLESKAARNRLPPEFCMIVRLLPSSPDEIGSRQDQRLTSLLVNDSILIDAGSAGFQLGRAELAKLRHVFISHAHMDHIASLPAMLDACLGYGLRPPAIHAGSETLQCLRQHVFNNRIWPDFLTIEENGRKMVETVEMNEMQPVAIGGLQITAVAVNHVVPTLGFILESDDATVVISSDTGPTEKIWQLASAKPRLDAVILEVSFTNQMQSLAEKALHLTPRLFSEELEKIKGHQPLALAVHLKPWLRDEICEQIRQLQLKNLEVMEPGRTYEFPPGAVSSSGAGSNQEIERENR